MQTLTYTAVHNYPCHTLAHFHWKFEFFNSGSLDLYTKIQLFFQKRDRIFVHCFEIDNGTSTGLHRRPPQPVLIFKTNSPKTCKRENCLFFKLLTQKSILIGSVHFDLKVFMKPEAVQTQPSAVPGVANAIKRVPFSYAASYIILRLS